MTRTTPTIPTAAPDDELPPVPEGVPHGALARLPFALIVTDSAQDDNPIVHCNRAFLEQTGYPVERVIGRNCRFLQGEDTDPEAIRALSEAVAERREVTVDILNYRADGTAYMNRLMMAPVYDDDGASRYFLGIQDDDVEGGQDAERAAELSERLREMQHRVKNHLSMLLALIRLEARRRDRPEDAIDVLAARVETLGLLYEQIATPAGQADETTVGLGEYVRRVSAAMQVLSDRARIGVNVDVERVEVAVDDAARIGLVLCEVLANAMQHAFDPLERGEVRVTLEHEADAVVLSVTDDGHGLGEADWPGGSKTLGAVIVRDLVRRLDGELEVRSAPGEGTTVRLSVPRIGIA